MPLVARLTLTVLGAIVSLPVLRGLQSDATSSGDPAGWDDDVTVFMAPPNVRTALCPMVRQHAPRVR